MDSLADTLEKLTGYVLWEAELQRNRMELNNSPIAPAVRDERDVKLKEELDFVAEKKEDILRQFAMFPHFHDRHREALDAFYDDGAFEASVFIMAKYAEGEAPIDESLQGVVDAVKDAVVRCAHVPRIAIERDYHDLLWDNVELHLLGCRRGIAIVESRYRPELNPNVAMEWGWMRGMGRDVLYLVEESFDQQRADWGGLIERKFDWNDPRATIVDAVHKWLRCPLDH